MRWDLSVLGALYTEPRVGLESLCVRLHSRRTPSRVQAESRRSPQGVHQESKWNPSGVQVESKRSSSGVHLESASNLVIVENDVNGNSHYKHAFNSAM